MKRRFCITLINFCHLNHLIGIRFHYYPMFMDFNEKKEREKSTHLVDLSKFWESKTIKCLLLGKVMMTGKRSTQRNYERTSCQNKKVSGEKGDFEIQRGWYKYSHLAEEPLKRK